MSVDIDEARADDLAAGVDALTRLFGDRAGLADRDDASISDPDIGRTSIGIFVDVWARRSTPEATSERVTSAEIVFVHVDADRNPMPIPKA